MNRRGLLQALLLAPWMLPRLSQADLGTLFGKIPADTRHVFAAGPPASVLVYCLAPEKLIGWPGPLSASSKSLLSAPAAALPAVGRLAGRGSTVSMEALLKQHPQLIVDIGGVNETQRSMAERVSRQTGIPYLLLDGRLADSPRQLLEAGGYFAAPERTLRLADQASAVLQSMPPPSRFSAYLARGADGLETGVGGSIHSEALELAGLHNVAAGLGDGGLGRVSLEQLLMLSPDMVLCQDETLHHHLLTSAQWKVLPAVRAGRVYRAPSLPFGWYDGPPGINRLLGLEWLAALLDAQRAKQLPGRVERFFRAFYQVELTPAQIGQLLATHPGALG